MAVSSTWRRCTPRRLLVAFALIAVVLLFAGLQAPASQAQTAPVSLLAGWNNLAYLGPAQPVLAGLSALDGKYDALWQYDAAGQAWRMFNPRAPETSDFTDLAQGTAYWIHMLQPSTLPVGQAGIALGKVSLAKGWNNIVQASASGPVASVMSALNVNYAAVWHWNPALQKWELFDPAAPQASDFQTLVQGQAYFVQVTSGTVNPPPSSCFPFTSYQPQFGEVADALNRAGANALLTDPAFTLGAAHIALDGSAATVPGYIPPTLLKAIAWVESNWMQADFSVARGSQGKTITSRTCAYGLLQNLTGMSINGSATDRQTLIGTDYIHNIAAGTQLLLAKWNFAPQDLPILGRRDPRVIEDWYYAVWAYNCYGDVCPRYGVHNNPDDPTLKWPRPMYNSPDYLASGGRFTIADYPYQELVFGLIAYPPKGPDGNLLWQPIPVQLPPHGFVGFPKAANVNEYSAHLDTGQALTPAVFWPTPTPSPTSSPSPTPSPAGTPTPSATPRPATYFPAVDSEAAPPP